MLVLGLPTQGQQSREPAAPSPGLGDGIPACRDHPPHLPVSVFALSPAVEFSSTFLFKKDSPTKLSKALSDGRDQLILVKIDLFEHRVLLFFYT